MKTTKIGVFFGILMGILGFGLGMQDALGQGCLDGKDKVGWLGITGLGSSGVSIRRNGDDLSVWFHQEPQVQGILPAGPADGKLQKGDVLTALDGLLITTRAAGTRLVAPAPGHSVTLSLRRAGKPISVEVTPIAMCPEDVPAFWAPPVPPAPPAPPAPAAPPAPPAPPAPTSVSRPAPAAPPAPPAAPAVPAPPAPPAPPPPPSPDGWFGFGFECSDCGWEKPDSGKAMSFRFRELPTIYSVDSDSPAEHAGLRRGDVLTRIGGIRLDSPEGSQRFFDVQPGEKVVFEYERSGAKGEAGMTAENPPYRRSWQRVQQRTERFQRELSEAIRQVTHIGDTSRLRQTIQSRIDEFVEQLKDMEFPLTDQLERNLRFAGNISDVDVEVRGWGTVDVLVDEDDDSLTIRTLDATIRLTRSPQKRP